MWLVRHAPVAVEGICYGQSDMPLSMPHDEAASLTMGRLAVLVNAAGSPRAPTRVIASPWDRTAGLAVRIATALGLPFDVDSRLSELSFGQWERKTYATLERDDGARFNRWTAAYLTERPPGGETLGELSARVRSFVNERRATEDVPLLVTHAGVIRAMRALESGRSHEEEMARGVAHLKPERLPFTMENEADAASRT